MRRSRQLKRPALKVPERFRKGITRYQPADEADLAEFQQQEFGPLSRQVDENRTRWLFDDNPLSAGDGRNLWVSRRDGAIVGQQGEIPFDLQVDDEYHRASWAVDLRVADAWRLRGVGPALLATLFDARPIVAAMNMSDLGLKLMERSGGIDLGVVPVYLRPLQLDRVGTLASVRPRLRNLLRPAAPVLSAADRLAVGAARLPGLHLEPVDRFDERVDQVWEAARTAYPVLARRDHAALTWLIDQRPDRDLMQRYYLCRKGRTLGYVVLRRAGTADEPTAVVVDYLARPRLVAPLLLAAAVTARRQGAIALSVKTRNEPADKYLRAAGFLRRSEGADSPITFMVHCAAEEEVCAKLAEPNSWFVTSADCDLEYGRTPPDADGDT